MPRDDGTTVELMEPEAVTLTQRRGLTCVELRVEAGHLHVTDQKPFSVERYRVPLEDLNPTPHEVRVSSRNWFIGIRPTLPVWRGQRATCC